MCRDAFAVVAHTLLVAMGNAMNGHVTASLKYDEAGFFAEHPTDAERIARLADDFGKVWAAKAAEARAAVETPDHLGDLGIVNVRTYGAVGDGVTDDTAAIQAAIDDAQTAVASSSHAPVVAFPAGIYLISDEIEKKSAPLIGLSAPNVGVRIVWGGAAGGTVFTQSADAGGASYGAIRNLNLRSGTNKPETWLDLTARTLDVGYRVSEVQFGGCSGDAVKLARVVNGHWSHLRFDSPGGFAISIAATGAMGTFHLSNFTYDHNYPDPGGSGFLHLDLAANTGNIGTVVIDNGRIEANSQIGGNNTIVQFSPVDESANARTVGLCLRDMTIVGAEGATIASIIHRDTENTSGSESFILENVRCENVTAYLGGTWPTTFPKPTGTPGLIGRLVSQQNAITLVQTEDRWHGTSTDVSMQTQLYNDTQKRWVLDASGKQTWGSGSAVGDTTLYRSGSNLLKTDDKFLAAAGIGVGNSASATTLGNVAAKMEVFDASGSSLGFVPIYDGIT